MRIIRASEIDTYLYCQRAWWYQIQGYESKNQAEMAGGTEMHYRHWRVIMISGCLRLAAYALLFLAFVLMAVYLTGQYLY